MFDYLFMLTFSLIYHILANVMKSMLQELDNNLISKDDYIHEQNCKLAEKDKIIQINKTEIERLEKKTKMQEHKVEQHSSLLKRSGLFKCLVS